MPQMAAIKRCLWPENNSINLCILISVRQLQRVEVEVSMSDRGWKTIWEARCCQRIRDISVIARQPDNYGYETVWG